MRQVASDRSNLSLRRTSLTRAQAGAAADVGFPRRPEVGNDVVAGLHRDLQDGDTSGDARAARARGSTRAMGAAYARASSAASWSDAWRTVSTCSRWTSTAQLARACTSSMPRVSDIFSTISQ